MFDTTTDGKTPEGGSDRCENPSYSRCWDLWKYMLTHPGTQELTSEPRGPTATLTFDLGDPDQGGAFERCNQARAMWDALREYRRYLREVEHPDDPEAVKAAYSVVGEEFDRIVAEHGVDLEL